MRRAEVTVILNQLPQGAADQSDIKQLFAAAYDELHGLARGFMRHERANHTLQSTALVNEAYLNLADADGVRLEGRAHFFGIAANVMRRILVEHARKRGAQKRGGDWRRISLTSVEPVLGDDRVDVLDLDDALTKLAVLHERSAKIVEMRIFGGLQMEAIAQLLGVTRRTVQKDWRIAIMWLRREFDRGM